MMISNEAGKKDDKEEAANNNSRTKIRIRRLRRTERRRRRRPTAGPKKKRTIPQLRRGAQSRQRGRCDPRLSGANGAAHKYYKMGIEKKI